MKYLSHPSLAANIIVILLVGFSLACSDKSDDKGSKPKGGAPKVADSKSKLGKNSGTKGNADTSDDNDDDEDDGDDSDQPVQKPAQSSTSTAASTTPGTTKPTATVVATSTGTGTSPAPQGIDPAVKQAACSSGLTAAQIVMLAQADAPPAGSGLTPEQFAQIKTALAGVTEAQVQAVLDTCPPP